MLDPNHTAESAEVASARRAREPRAVRPLGKEAATLERRSLTPRGATPDLRPLKRRQQTLQAYQMNFDTLAVPLEQLGRICRQS
jgi:hypothetical protein